MEEYKSNIIANVSHELLTPITIASGYIELAQGEEDPAQRNEMLEMALGALERQNAIVSDLIEAANLQGNGNFVPSGKVELDRVLRDIVTEMVPVAEEKDVRFELDLGCDGSRIEGEYQQIKHAFRNIISNSVKFNKSMGSVVISTRQKDGAVEVSIKDTGIGIPEEIRDRIFDPFYQGDSSPTRKYGGTGLGLAITKEVIKNLGGSIMVESQVDQGSCFKVKLPVAGEAL
ncbi:MAG: HAMP domain-containing histidine kinase [Euryarchaeota archaeon]|nr:HAMP domain-containing histidine kinase [Euryarchaeota archaeon]